MSVCWSMQNMSSKSCRAHGVGLPLCIMDSKALRGPHDSWHARRAAYASLAFLIRQSVDGMQILRLTSTSVRLWPEELLSETSGLAHHLDWPAIRLATRHIGTVEFRKFSWPHHPQVRVEKQSCQHKGIHEPQSHNQMHLRIAEDPDSNRSVSCHSRRCSVCCVKHVAVGKDHIAAQMLVVVHNERKLLTTPCRELDLKASIFSPSPLHAFRRMLPSVPQQRLGLSSIPINPQSKGKDSLRKDPEQTLNGNVKSPGRRCDQY